jgi:hypothetical protein
MSENQINLPFPDQENTGPTLEEQAAAIDAEETTEAQAQDDTPERPDWLPQKFKTPEDMARSYAELEKKLGSNKQQQEEAVEQATQESATNMDGLISSAETEFLENGGELSDSTYEQFEKMGVPRTVVDQVRDMRVAQAEQTRQQIINEFGGQESVDAMSTFAASNYDDGMIERLNGMLASNDLATVRMAMNQIRSDFQAQAPAQDPTRRVSGRSLPAIEGFRSQAEIIEAINDPRYRNDNAYREDVERRIGMSNL